MNILITFSILIFLFLIFIIFLIFFSYLTLNKKLQDKILSKFNNYLIEQCKKENIKIELFNTLEQLNKNINEPDKNKWAIGNYEYCYTKEQIPSHLNKNLILDKTLKEKIPTEIVYNTSKSKISLLKNYNVLTLAHEVGHHFSIKNNKNESEIAADNYINTLANEYLNYWERYCLSISLSVYSKIDVKYNYFKILKEYFLFKFKSIINHLLKP